MRHNKHPRLSRVRTAAAGIAVLGSLLGVASLISVHADQYSQQITSLQSQESTLQSQLQSIANQKNSASQAAVATAVAINQTEQQLASAHIQLDQANAALAQTTAQLYSTQQVLATDKAQLSTALKNLYEQDGNSTLMTVIINSNNLNAFFNQIFQLQSVGQKFQGMTSAVQTEEIQLQNLDNQQQQQEQSVSALVTQLEDTQARLENQEQEYTAEVAALTGQSAQVAQQAQQVVGQINNIRAQQEEAAAAAALAAERNASGSINSGSIPVGGSTYNNYPWGQCTWYVASRRDVPWGGDAWEWLGNAQAMGFSTGMTPEVGSIVVWGRYSNWYDYYYGHVAYVVAVQSATSFTVDEGNYYSLGVVDQRQVNTLYDVEGFIYG